MVAQRDDLKLVVFSCIRATQFCEFFESFRLNLNSRKRFNYAWDVRLSIVEVTLPRNNRSKVAVGDWYLLNIASSDSLSERTVRSLSAGEILGQFESIEGVLSDIGRIPKNSRDWRSLTNFFSLNDIAAADPTELQCHLRNLHLVNQLNVLDVGQGNCVALGKDDWRPLYYFDLGCGCFSNASTLTTRPRLCWTADPSVILSHWDVDHWWLASIDPKACERVWIAPRQTIGPLAWRFAARLNSSGTLLLLEQGAANAIAIAGPIHLCCGRSRNDSGIAMNLNLGSSVNVLLPGDANPKFISNLEQLKFHATIAPHHGGYIRNVIIPAPVGLDSVVVYSYGRNNSYGHPSKGTLDRFQKASWTTALHTTSGNIGISSSSIQNYGPPCHGLNCTLRPKILVSLM